jgi:glutathione S-transferase
MKLYHSTSSPNSRRVRMFIAEKGISIPLQSVNLGEKEQFSDWFKEVNPRRQVPALVLDDGTTIAEVPAIWRFLEETFPEHPLLGDDATSKALVTMWERRVELDGFAPTMEGVRNAVAGLKGRAIAGPYDYDQIPALVARSRLRVKNFYADLDTRLAARPFIAGGHFSAADITGVVTVAFATKAMGLPVPDEHKALRRWFQNVSSRPSAVV